MRCPYCRHPDSRVVDSREQDEGQVIRRRRSCLDCGRRFTTVEEATLAVIKRSGVTEPFSRTKVVNGVRRACQGRPVDEDQLAQLAQSVEDAVRATGAAEVPSDEVGLAILGPLRQLDEVAYLRFASVYKAFSSIDDFEKAIADLRAATESRHRRPSWSGRTVPAPSPTEHVSRRGISGHDRSCRSAPVGSGMLRRITERPDARSTRPAAHGTVSEQRPAGRAGVHDGRPCIRTTR